MYQDAVKNGGGQEIIGAIVAGLGPAFQLIDNAIGLRKFKDFVYDLNIANFTGLSKASEALENVADDGNLDNTTYAEMTAALLSGVVSGLEKIGGVNAIADTMTEAADDGDDSHVSAGEKTVEIIKGVGRGVDSFIGSQGAAFMGGLAGAVEAGGLAVEQALANPITREAAKAIVGEIVTAYFTYEGATLAVDGIKQAVSAESKEEAGEAGEKLGMAAFMLAGGLKVGKKVLDNGISRIYEARVEKLNAKYREMEPQALIEELGNNPRDIDYFAIRTALKDKGYSVMERPIAKGKTQTVVYTPEGKPIEVKASDGSGVSDKFKKDFDAAKSTQDLEMMVANAKTSAECDYIAAKLNNPNTMAVNRPQIERVIDLAKFRAERLRADEQSGVSEEFIVEFNKCRSTQDLGMMVANAKTSAECDYIANQLSSKPITANSTAIERVIDLAKFRAERLRADELGTKPATQADAITNGEVVENGATVTYKNGKKTKEVLPDGTERRFNAYDETLEFKPDKTFVKYDKDGNVIQTEVWEEIDGTKMSLSEAEYLWTGDHTGHHTLNPEVRSKIEAFIESANKAKADGSFVPTPEQRAELDANGYKMMSFSLYYYDSAGKAIPKSIATIEYNGTKYNVRLDKKYHKGEEIEAEILKALTNKDDAVEFRLFDGRKCHNPAAEVTVPNITLEMLNENGLKIDENSMRTGHPAPKNNGRRPIGARKNKAVHASATFEYNGKQYSVEFSTIARTKAKVKEMLMDALQGKDDFAQFTCDGKPCKNPALETLNKLAAPEPASTDAQAAVRKTGATQTKMSMEKVENRYTDESLKKNFSSMMDEIESNPDIQAGNWDSHELKSDPHYDYEVYTKKVTLKNGSTATYELTVYKDDGFVNRKVYLENEVDGSEVVTSFEFFDCDTNNGWTYQTNKSGIRYNMSYDPHGKEYISPLKTDVIVKPQSAEVPTPIRTPQQTTVSGNFKQPQTQEIISAVEAKVAKGEPLTQELINETIRETFAKTENPDVNDMIRVMDDIKGNWSKMPEVYKNDIPTTLKDIDDIYSRAKNSHDLLGVTEKDVEALKRRIMQEPDLLVRTSAVNGQGSYKAVVQLLKDVHSMINPKIPEDITGAARLVVGKFKNRLMPKDIESIETLELWAKKQIESIYNVETHEMNPDFIAEGKLEITNARQRELERWTTYLKSDESPLNDDPCGQLLLLDGITKDISRQNTNVPPAVSRGMVEDVYNRIIQDAIEPVIVDAIQAEPTPAPTVNEQIQAMMSSSTGEPTLSTPLEKPGQTPIYLEDTSKPGQPIKQGNGKVWETRILDKSFHGKRLQIAKPIVVDGQASFRLDGKFELNLNSPEIKNILDGLAPGEEISIGKEGDIKIENLYTKKHLTIKKLSDNQFEVTPFGQNGTEIKLADISSSSLAKAHISELVNQIEVVSYRQSERPKMPERSNYSDPRDYGEDYHDYANWTPKTYVRYTYKGQTKLYEYDGYANQEEMKNYIAKMIYESQQ